MTQQHPHASTAPPSASVHRKRQMETRLRLRRRLLRINSDASLLSAAPQDSSDDDDDAAAAAANDELTRVAPRRSLSTHKRKTVVASMATLVAQRTASLNALQLNEKDEEEEEDNDDEEESEEEGDGDEDDDDDEDEDDTEDAAAATASSLPPKKADSKALEPAATVRLLLSGASPRTRHPTVWFEYPAALGVQRPVPPPCRLTNDRETLKAAVAVPVPRVLSVAASDCPLFYKTHWERNCVKQAFAVAGMRRTKTRWRGWHTAWAKHVPRDKFRCLRGLQVFNHFPDPWVIGRKDRLLRTLSVYRRRHGDAYAFFPDGFTLPDQWDAFRRATSSSSSTLPRDDDGHNVDDDADADADDLWILKPPASACGRGIRVVRTRDVERVVREKARRRQRQQWVLQRYIARPLLLDGLKFDLRLYVLVTSVDPLRVYLFNEGLTRFCTTPYALSNLRNRFAHLTNYSVNKANVRAFVENDGVDRDDVGSKWSLTALLHHLAARALVPDVARVMAQIQAIVIKTIIAAEAHLTPLLHQCVKRGSGVRCYELFGFDLVLDHRGAPWLLEVNVSPSLMGNSPLDKRVKGLLLSDVFHLVGVPVPLATLPKRAIPPEYQPAVVEPPSSSSSSSTRSVNKELHEVVLDPDIKTLAPSHLTLLTPQDWDVLHQLDDEFERRGHFDRIFPCATADATAQYTPFFTCPRYSNALCAKWIETKRLQQKQQQQQTAPAKSRLSSDGRRNSGNRTQAPPPPAQLAVATMATVSSSAKRVVRPRASSVSRTTLH